MSGRMRKGIKEKKRKNEKKKRKKNKTVRGLLFLLKKKAGRENIFYKLSKRNEKRPPGKTIRKKGNSSFP